MVETVYLNAWQLLHLIFTEGIELDMIQNFSRFIFLNRRICNLGN